MRKTLMESHKHYLCFDFTDSRGSSPNHSNKAWNLSMRRWTFLREIQGRQEATAFCVVIVGNNRGQVEAPRDICIDVLNCLKV